MTNTYNFAKTELEILFKSMKEKGEESVLGPFFYEILEVCERFGLSGQSGGSAPFVATALGHVIKKLCLQEAISPITGIKDEWFEAREGLIQNVRCSALFKEHEDGPAWYLDAIVFKDQTGHTFTGSVPGEDGETIFSRQYIKAFPFEPKTFYIDVVATEIAKGDWDYKIKSPHQLTKAFKYYDKYHVKN